MWTTPSLYISTLHPCRNPQPPPPPLPPPPIPPAQPTHPPTPARPSSTPNKHQRVRSETCSHQHHHTRRRVPRTYRVPHAHQEAWEVGGGRASPSVLRTHPDPLALHTLTGPLEHHALARGGSAATGWFDHGTTFEHLGILKLRYIPTSTTHSPDPSSKPHSPGAGGGRGGGALSHAP